MAIATQLPQSRRALLAGALGSIAAGIAVALGRPDPASAAAGSALIIGSEANNAGSANTQLLTNSSVVAFKLLQNGPGTALMGYATPATGATRGVYGRTDSPNGYGVQARNAGAIGSGAAIQAIGDNNTGIDASTSAEVCYAVRGVHTGDPGGVAVYGTSAAGVGVAGSSTNGIGVVGSVSGETAVGVWGSSTSGAGVVGSSDSGLGVRGESASGTAGYFEGSVEVTKYVELSEMTAPANALSDRARLFVRDNGASKTQLCVIFPTGAIQVLSTEP